MGLGNPGSEYDGTRHNIGFEVVDAIAEKLRIVFEAGSGDYLEARATHGESDFLLVKPLTYMNNSGLAVRDVFEKYSPRMEDLVVVLDDFHLPLGTIRIRRRGSSGGHNGLSSIIYHMQTEDFPRLRIGIGKETRSGAVEFVLSPFDDEERETVRDAVLAARDAAFSIVTVGLDSASSRLSRRKE